MNKGFTLIEILVSIGILAFIVSLGLLISIDFFRGYSFSSEEKTIVSVLQKARSQSMNNIDQSRHGVYFQAGTLKYIIFECKSGKPQCTDYTDADTTQDITADPKYGSTVSGVPFSIVFDQLSGCMSSPSNNCTASPVTILANDNGKTRHITVNGEGQIDWQ